MPREVLINAKRPETFQAAKLEPREKGRYLYIKLLISSATAHNTSALL